MSTKTKVKYSGALRKQWLSSLLMALSLLVLSAVLLAVDRRAGWIALAFTAVYLLVAVCLYLHFRGKLFQELVRFASRYESIEEQLLSQIEVPVLLCDPDGRCLWMNSAATALTEKPGHYRKSITAIFPELRPEEFPLASRDRDVSVKYGERDFRAHIQRVSLEGLLDGSEVALAQGEEQSFCAVYLFDETELRSLAQENQEQKSVLGLVYIDNYEESMEQVDEVHQSLLNVLVDREINRYFTVRECLTRKLEKDKYLIICNRKSLNLLIQDRFSVLEEVKTINIGNDSGMTVSIGIGSGARTWLQNYEAARSAIEMALGRGGDQAVVKDDQQMTFYGGKSQRTEKITRVKARVKAQAMHEIISTKDRVIAMGHHLPDMDSLGAAVGVYRAAVTLGKQAHIVIGDDSPTLRTWLASFRESRGYEPDLFISHEKAMELADENTALVVVDTNRAGMVECPELLEMIGTVVVLDHHRQTTDSIQGAALSYIEPAASSASEMISEILQYFEEDVRLKNLEADCLYAGIIIDTNNFVAKTGARTFEAAAYLRRAGADVTRVRKALRDDMTSYRAKGEAVSRAQFYMDSYAISTLPPEGLESPNVIAAQAANELLNIIGVKASFVLTSFEGKIFISARAIDELNVQLVMERLGGGGHLNIAGAQLTGVTLDEAVEKVKQTLREMTEEGAI